MIDHIDARIPFVDSTWVECLFSMNPPALAPRRSPDDTSSIRRTPHPPHTTATTNTANAAAVEVPCHNPRRQRPDTLRPHPRVHAEVQLLQLGKMNRHLGEANVVQGVASAQQKRAEPRGAPRAKAE